MHRKRDLLKLGQELAKQDFSICEPFYSNGGSCCGTEEKVVPRLELERA
jgi:hypothetical protein